MTVKELIAKLQEQPQDAPVIIQIDDDCSIIDDVITDDVTLYGFTRKSIVIGYSGNGDE